MPSSHQWWPVAATTNTVTGRCISTSHLTRLRVIAKVPSATTAAQPTWIDGIAANWSDTPVPTSP